MKLFCDISATLAVATLLAATDFANLKLNPLDWFSANTTTQTGGTIACPPENGKFAISCDADDFVSFTTANGYHATQDIVSVTLTLDATIAGESQLTSLPQDQSCFAIALCEKENSGVLSTNFVAWTGSVDWLTLDAGSAALPAAGESYELIARLDNRESATSATKIQLAFKRQGGSEIVLKYNTTEWLACSQAFSKDADFVVGFFGDGAVASLVGKQYEILSEVIVVGDVSIDIQEADMKKFEASKPTTYTTVNDFLQAEAKTAFGETAFKTPNLKVAEAYALGLIEDVNGTMTPVNNGEITIKADAQATVADGIKLEFLGGVEPRTDTGTEVTYQLKGSTNGTDWAPIGDASTTKPTIPLANVGTGNEKYRYFKVVTTLCGR